jgi:hypothetical protein
MKRHIKFTSYIANPEDEFGELEVLVNANVNYNQGFPGSLSNRPGFEIEDLRVLYRDTMTGEYRNLVNQLSRRDLEALESQVIEWYRD